jgi:hypothetical protein
LTRAPALLAAGALVALAACHDGLGPGHCFEPNVQAYGFAMNGDTNLVFHWPASYMPVRVYAEPTGQLPANVGAAMSLWVGAFRCGELSLAVATDSTKADIIVRNPASLPVAQAASRAIQSDSVGACTGVTRFELDSTGPRLASPIHSYVAPLSTDTVAVASCYHFVTAHELGHALGIFAHSPDTNDLMYTAPRRRVLSEADRYTIQLLYHTPSKVGPPPRP